MSKIAQKILEVLEMHDYPHPRGGLRKFMVIEYEVTKIEVNRYYVYQEETVG